MCCPRKDSSNQQSTSALPFSCFFLSCRIISTPRPKTSNQSEGTMSAKRPTFQISFQLYVPFPRACHLREPYVINNHVGPRRLILFFFTQKIINPRALLRPRPYPRPTSLPRPLAGGPPREEMEVHVHGVGRSWAGVQNTKWQPAARDVPPAGLRLCRWRGDGFRG